MPTPDPLSRRGILRWTLVPSASILSGCSFFQGNPSADESTQPPPEPVDNTATTSTQTTTIDTTEETSTTTPVDEEFSTDVETGGILLGLSDLEGQYDLITESEIYRSNTSGERRTTFREKGVAKQHRRLFQAETDAGSRPLYIISSFVIYDTRADAMNDLEGSVADLEANRDGITTTPQIQQESVTVVEYQDRQRNYQTIAYVQDRNAVYYVLTTGIDRYYRDVAIELLALMIADTDSIATAG